MIVPMPTRPDEGVDEAAAAARVRELEELRVEIETRSRLAEQSYASLIEALAAAARRLAEIGGDDPAAGQRPASTDAPPLPEAGEVRVGAGPIGERAAAPARKAPAD